MQSINTAIRLCSVMASKPGHSKLYKKKIMVSMVTPEINLVYP
jgi:hypothetical protein